VVGAISLLIGAFISSVAAALGGNDAAKKNLLAVGVQKF
jgi:outer membrane murein-binding lipoprotein Lpp